MKRTLMVIALSSIALATVAATKSLPYEVRTALQRALVNEREAVARYEAFARKADEEGYRGAAALFRAQAQAERVHGQRFEAALRAHEVALPAGETFSPVVGSTGDNLRNAASAERAERDGAYREAIETCNLHSATEIAKLFDQTRDSEVEHANLCTTASHDLESMKEARTYYVCDKCGYTTDVKLPFCPACQHKKAPTAVD